MKPIIGYAKVPDDMASRASRTYEKQIEVGWKTMY
jgi:hypothetical protein